MNEAVLKSRKRLKERLAKCLSNNPQGVTMSQISKTTDISTAMLCELLPEIGAEVEGDIWTLPIKQEILQEALKPTVYRLDYFDGEYRWDLVHSYDRAELEKLIEDATEYHKTIKDLDFNNYMAVETWLEKHPLNDFNGDQINDLLDIDDYEPLSEYLSINFFNVSGVSE